MSPLQDDFNNQVAYSFRLNCGLKGSNTKHEYVKKFCAIANLADIKKLPPPTTNFLGHYAREVFEEYVIETQNFPLWLRKISC